MMFITQNLVLLVNLDLKDRPLDELFLRHYLTIAGVQSLGSYNIYLISPFPVARKIVKHLLDE